MTIEDMHYDFKTKLNKVDSEQNRNLLIPEIDWVLNEAQLIFIKRIAMPRSISFRGFEKTQRNIDDIRKIVVSESPIDITDNIATLPDNYLFFIKADVMMEREGCDCQAKARLFIRQQDDKFEESIFDKSSYDWREVNGVFIEQGVRLYDDGTFTNKNLVLSYIRKPAYMHYAEGFRAGGYLLPSGVSLTGKQDCELASQTHSEIVDIAVMLVSGELLSSDYQQKVMKLNINELI